MRPTPLCLTVILAFAAVWSPAQPTVAPTGEPVGKTRGENVGEYNFVNSFETGYRFVETSGNAGKYHSDVNYSDGVRLLSSFFSVNSREGHGRYFDELVVTTQGLGGDPYESATFRIQKNKLYRYDLLWRQDEYLNPAITISHGEHSLNTLRRFQDHDLTLFPQSNFKIFLGYSRNTQSGAGITTIQLFDSRGDEFPLFANIHRQRNEYRLGNEIKVAGFRLNWLHGWDDFKEDTPVSLTAPSAGDNPNDRVTLSSLTRSEPYHGTSPYWRVALFKEDKAWYGINGRFTYTAGRRAFVLNELDNGTSRFGAAFNRQVITYGSADRPVATGNLTFSLFPNSHLTVSNHTSIYNARTDGNSYYLSVDNATQATTVLNFQYLGIRTFANQTELDYRFNKTIGIFAGYNYSNRRIRSIEQSGVPGDTPTSLTGDQTNQLHAGTFGLRLHPAKPLTVVLDGEIGRADRPIYPISDRNYQLLGARVRYKVRDLTISALARSNYNTNSVSLSSYSSRARTYSADISWQPRAWLSFDASYSKLHLNTAAGIAYFANFNFVTGETSYYFSNIHHGNLGARLHILGRGELFVGYSRIQDTGDGRNTVIGTAIGSALPNFQAVQSYPLSFQSPLVRFSLKLQEKLRWNFGYQYYGYNEEFSAAQNYHASTGYTSLSWSF